MLGKVKEEVRQFGIGYTLKKIIYKLYIGYVLGPCKVNRRLMPSTRQKQERTKFQRQVCISIVVPLYNTPEKYLRDMLQSVVQQTYKNWQLCLMDASEESYKQIEQVCKEYVAKDSRIGYWKVKNKGISENTNAGIDVSKGEYLALLDHDDVLHPSALYEVVACIDGQDADVIYTDEATFCGKKNHLLSIYHKPQFYSENLRANNYICHFLVFRKELLKKCGKFRKEFDGSQDHDMILRLSEVTSRICHIPMVLYFWRAHRMSVAMNLDSKDYAVQAGKTAVESHLKRCNIPAEVQVSEGKMLTYQVMYRGDENWRKEITILQEGEVPCLDCSKMGKYVLLLAKGMAMPKEEELYMVAMHFVKSKVGAVTAKITDGKGRLLSAGIEIRNRGGRKQIHHLYQRNLSSEPGYMNCLTHPTGIEAICNGFMLIRAKLLADLVEEQEGEQLEIFEPEVWLRWSEQMKNCGYELISENRVCVAYQFGQWYNKMKSVKC